MKWFYIISVALVAALSAAPFYLIRKDSAVGDAQAEGKMVSYGSYGAKIRSLDPATCGDTMSAMIQGNFYEGLYCYHFLKRPVVIIPQLAEGMPQISDDKLTYTFKLKPGVKYHRNECFGLDGEGHPKTRTVTADDFVLGFKRIADFHIDTPMAMAFIEDKIVGVDAFREKSRTYDKGNFARYREVDLEGVKALDELTLQIKLKVPFPQLIDVLAINCYAPIPHEIIDYWLSTQPVGDHREEIPLKDRDPTITTNIFKAAVGTGPYFLTKFVDGGDIVLERNPDFRVELYPSEGEGPSKDYPGDEAMGLLKDAGKPVPFIDVQTLIYVPEDNPAWSLFLSKRTDVSGIPREVYSMVVTPGAALTSEWGKQGIRLYKSKDPAVYWYGFNMNDKTLGASKSLRQALNLAFNVKLYVDVLFNGRGVPAVNTIPSDFRDQKFLPVCPYAHFDLAAAKAKMDEAKKELIAAGVLKPGEEIPRLTLDLPGLDEQERRIGEFARYELGKLGVDLKIELNDWPTLQKKVETKQYQIFAMGWHADYDDPENFLQLYYTPNIERGTNQTCYSNPKFDELYAQAAKMMASPERTDIYRRMVEILNEDCPSILLTEPIGFTLSWPWVYNVKPHPFGYGFGKYRRIDAQARTQAQEQ
jgi:ABC-type transport system substrate-binding protein